MSLSPNPLSPLDRGAAAKMATLHPERVGPRHRGHDCQSHPEDLYPPPPNSVSTCRLIKVLRIEEFCLGDMAKVNELVVPFGCGRRGGVGGVKASRGT